MRNVHICCYTGPYMWEHLFDHHTDVEMKVLRSGYKLESLLLFLPEHTNFPYDFASFINS